MLILNNLDLCVDLPAFAIALHIFLTSILIPNLRYSAQSQSFYLYLAVIWRIRLVL